LNLRFQRVLTLVEAGAGFGKTSLIGQATTESGDLDRAVDVLVRCRPRPVGDEPMAAALADVARRLGCEPTVTAVADAVLAAAPRPVVLWFDDVHHLAETEGGASAIDQLLRLLPTNGHLVLVGRRLPELSISKLELEGQVERLDEEDLRFDVDERAAFLHLRGQAADTSAAEAASGWPAVMELEAVAGPSGIGRSGAADYLTQEVLGHLEPARLQILRRLSTLDQFDQSMIDAVAADSDAGGRVGLDDLVDGLPLVSTVADQSPDGDRTNGEEAFGPVVVLHDLLRDALGAELSDDDRSITLGRVGRELLRRDRLAEAARHLADVGDVDGIELVAARLIEDLHVATGVGDRMEAVELVGRTLGEAAVAKTLRGVTMLFTEPLNAEPVLADARAAANVEGRHDLEALCIVRLAESYYGRGERVAIDELRRDLAALADGGEPTAQRFGFLLEIWSLRLAGQEDGIVDLVDRIAPDLDDEMRSVALTHRTLSTAYCGRLVEAVAQAESQAERLPPGLHADRIRGFMTIQLWMLGEQTDDVRQQARRLVDRIEARGQMHLFVEGAATTAVFAASVGELSAAGDLAARAEGAVSLLPDGAWAHHSLAQARAVVQLLTGDEEGAAATLEAAIPPGGPFDGLPRHIYSLTGALSYALVPRSRAAWDDAGIGGELAVRLDLARALVAFRERGETAPAAALPWADGHLLRPWAFGPHLAELAVAAIAGGNDDAAEVLADTRYDSIDVLDQLERSDSKPVSAAARKAIQVSPRRPAATVELGLLGPLTVKRGGVDEGETPAWRRARVRDLVSLLAHDQTISRQVAAGLLWPDKSEKAAQNNLRSNLSYLLSALEPARTGSRPSWFVRTVGDKLTLDGGEFLVVDVHRFESARSAATALDGQAPRQALTHHLEACELYRGDLLAGSGLEQHVYFESMRLRGDYVASATRAADLLVSMGEPERAEAVALRAAAIEPLNEPLQRSLVAALFAQRRFGAARDVVRALLDELDQLDIPPEPETALAADRLGLG
jgi:DNA-binding SARP family transcriptional activator